MLALEPNTMTLWHATDSPHVFNRQRSRPGVTFIIKDEVRDAVGSHGDEIDSAALPAQLKDLV
ncbi:hypothetical protein [Lysobacter gummosus]|uniref:hypothetical protein n=1 Tax=Lysobacter gummosus TaxID=262324 RepID=UPI0036363CAE